MKQDLTPGSKFVGLIIKTGHPRLFVSLVFLILCCFISMFHSHQSLAWDAGDPTERCKTDPCTGGVKDAKLNVAGVIEGWFSNSRVADCPAGYTNTGLLCSRPTSTISTAAPVSATCPPGYTNTGVSCYQKASTYSAPSRLASCPSGYTNMGLYCQKSPPFGKTTSTMTCPAGYFKGAAKRCYKKCRAGYTNNGEFCGRGASTISLTRATCPSGKFRTGAYCYDQCPTGYSNSGLGKCVRLGTTLGLKSMSCKSDEHFDSGRCIKLPKVKIRGNTHLWVVNQAVNMLARSNDPLARRAANTMLEPTCALKWKEGLYDGDAKLADNPVKSSTSGTHFYNPVNKDWLGNYTKSTTYLMAGADASERVGSNLKTFNAPNAKQSAASRIKQVPATGPTASTGCYELGLALHYMTDMTQPMHTSSFSGASSPLWLHPYFEAYVPVVQARYPANLSWDQRWRGLSPDETFDKTSIRSNGLAPNLLKVLTVQGKKCTMQDADLSPLSYNGYCFVNDPKVDAQIGIVLKDGYQSTASYIYNVFNTF